MKKENEIYDLGMLCLQQKKFKEALELFLEIIEMKPDHKLAYIKLAVTYKELNQLEKAAESYKKAIKIDPSDSETYLNQAIIFKKLKNNDRAIDLCKESIKIDNNYEDAHYFLALIYRETGRYKKAINSFEKTIKINPRSTRAYNNLGLLLSESGEKEKAAACYNKAIEINPNYIDPYWNLHSFAKNIDDALNILNKLHKIDRECVEAEIMINILETFKGNGENFNKMMKTSLSNHPIARSAQWVFSLPTKPKIFFNRWDFFKSVVKLANKTRPFYEFGVWNGVSFKFLIKEFKKGYGFDTFKGLPEDWDTAGEAKGYYSSYNKIPRIKGGKFITGEYEKSLPKFFSTKKPLASLINFDADLYSSTLCALNNVIKVIDESSILIFDEFLTNIRWEEDEYKALNEFCENNRVTYEVLAVSFFSKQVAVKLKMN